MASWFCGKEEVLLHQDLNGTDRSSKALLGDFLQVLEKSPALYENKKKEKKNNLVKSELTNITRTWGKEKI